jgi:hypothetical protein
MLNYGEKHPTLRIPNKLASSYLDQRTDKRIDRQLERKIHRITAVGKIAQDSFDILIYDLGSWSGKNKHVRIDGTLYIDSIFDSEFRIASRRKNQMPLGNHLFGHYNGNRYNDRSCGVFLPDLSIEVYTNPLTVKRHEKYPCRIDYQISFTDFGFMESRYLRYCEADTQKLLEPITLFTSMR